MPGIWYCSPRWLFQPILDQSGILLWLLNFVEDVKLKKDDVALCRVKLELIEDVQGSLSSCKTSSSGWVDDPPIIKLMPEALETD